MTIIMMIAIFVEKNATSFAQLILCLHDRSLSLVKQHATADNSRKATTIIRQHYLSKNKTKPKPINILL